MNIKPKFFVSAANNPQIPAASQFSFFSMNMNSSDKNKNVDSVNGSEKKNANGLNMRSNMAVIVVFCEKSILKSLYITAIDSAIKIFGSTKAATLTLPPNKYESPLTIKGYSG